MLHFDGRAPQRGKHKIVTLRTSKLNRAVADISAGVPSPMSAVSSIFRGIMPFRVS